MRPPTVLLAVAVIIPALVIAAAMCVPPLAPLVDMPNHLARAYIIHHLGENPALAAFYEYHFVFCPYVLGDLALAGLLNFFSPFHAARIWALFLFFSFPAAWLFYLHARRSAVVLSNPVYLALLLYLSLNYFFLGGYNSYCLSVSFCFVGMGLWERWRRTAGASAWLWYLGFAIVVAAAYLSHLAGFFFFGIFLAALVLARRTIDVSAVLSGLPFVLVAAWHLRLDALGGSGEDAIEYLPLIDKILGLGAASIRYNIPVDACLLLVFLGLCAAAALRGKRAASDSERRDMLLLTAVSLLAFAALPYGIGYGLQSDLRAVQFTMVFFLTYAFSRLGGEPLPRWTAGATAVFAIVNVAAVVLPWQAATPRLAQYQRALADVPPGKKILAIYTWPRSGRFDPGIHQADLYAVIGNGFSPDIYSNSNSVRQFPYFSFRTGGYTAGEFWYVRGEDAAVDWGRIAETYDYLIVTKPFDRSRIKIDGARTAHENEAVAVLAVKAPGS